MSDPAQLDTKTYDDPVRRMMESSDRCLNCGANIKYHRNKEKRRNAGYCSLECYYAYPPKLAYIQHEYNEDPRDVICDLLNHNDNVTRTAELLGVRKQTLYRWLDKLAIQRKVEWV